MYKKGKYIFNSEKLMQLFNGITTKALVFTTEGKEYFLEFDNPDNKEINKIVDGYCAMYTNFKLKNNSTMMYYINENAVDLKKPENLLYYENFEDTIFGNIVFIIKD